MEPSTEAHSLRQLIAEAVPAALVDALAGTPAYLVGGAVRDALDGHRAAELDVAVEGELDPILDRLGLEARSHERFGTASLRIDGRKIDLARTRRETYSQPGALPDVAPAPIRTDLARRDFTINAMAVPLKVDPELLDPYDGRLDLGARMLRVIHPGSFRDDPTRALRAARYAARLGLTLEAETERQLLLTDLSSVSSDRIDADLLRLAEEEEAVRGFELLDRWGLLALGEERLTLLRSVAEVLRIEPWAGLLPRAQGLLEVTAAEPSRLEAARSLAELDTSQPASALFLAARGHDDGLLLLARALGADWLDRHLGEWRRVSLQIDGSDLIAAGIAEGPDVGIGLQAALAARIDGRLDADAKAGLGVALAAIRATGRI
jgi:tRNA nucleotidyltransferase (CCA-adding enzyme)